MTAEFGVVPPPETVHVWKGRNQHIAADYIRTLCGKWWVALNIGPPATEKPMCRRCEKERDRV